jgi:hypothetical protein
MKIDHHIHIGQFEKRYYEPKAIIDIVLSSGMDGLIFSSTSTCIKDILYTSIEKEISAALNGFSNICSPVKSYLWYIPDYIFQGVTPRNAFESIPYQGIKLHPYAQKWDFSNSGHMDVLNDICEFAQRNKIPVLIHTGMSESDNCNRFEFFFEKFSGTKFILAHCRPPAQIILMLQKYQNVFCDSSFVEFGNIQMIINAGYKERVYFGTDFPITYHWQKYYLNEGKNKRISLEKQYLLDIENLTQIGEV